MANDTIYGGPAVRQLRRQAGLTQAAMAGQLGISASYLNLIERNRRALSARVIMRLVSEFDFDPKTLQADTAIGGIDGLAGRLSDEQFAGLNIDRDQIAEFYMAHPQMATAMARLYDNSSPSVRSPSDLGSACHDVIERWRNHFADLDLTAENLADDLRLSRGDMIAALTDRLRERHQLATRILPADVLAGACSMLDLHSRQVQISEMLSPAARQMELAMQLCNLEERPQIDALVQGADLPDSSARSMFEQHLYTYFAVALVLPYRRFLRACQATGYDLPLLQRRFNVSFAQLAFRLTTLQRVGERGLPFFCLRIDRAGQISKALRGASETAITRSDVACPLWTVHDVFSHAGTVHMQQVAILSHSPAEWTFLSALTEADDQPGSQFAYLLGLQTKFAAELAQMRGTPLRKHQALPSGLGCRRCPRENCHQRALPYEGRG